VDDPRATKLSERAHSRARPVCIYLSKRVRSQKTTTENPTEYLSQRSARKCLVRFRHAHRDRGDGCVLLHLVAARQGRSQGQDRGRGEGGGGAGGQGFDREGTAGLGVSRPARTRPPKADAKKPKPKPAAATSAGRICDTPRRRGAAATGDASSASTSESFLDQDRANAEQTKLQASTSLSARVVQERGRRHVLPRRARGVHEQEGRREEGERLDRGPVRP